MKVLNNRRSMHESLRSICVDCIVYDCREEATNLFFENYKKPDLGNIVLGEDAFYWFSCYKGVTKYEWLMGVYYTEGIVHIGCFYKRVPEVLDLGDSPDWGFSIGVDDGECKLRIHKEFEALLGDKQHFIETARVKVSILLGAIERGVWTEEKEREIKV